MRNEILPSSSVTDSKTFEEKITLAKEIADVLRKNIVQARRVENEDRWRKCFGFRNFSDVLTVSYLQNYR